MTGRTRLQPSRRQQPGEHPGWLAAAAVLLAGIPAALLVWAAARLTTPGLPGPAPFLVGLLTGRTGWPGGAATTLAAAALAVLGVAVAAAAVLGWRAARRPTRTRVDAKAASMARPQDLRVLLPAGAAAEAARLGANGASNGVPIGRLLPGRQVLRSTWEFTQVWLMGTRSGKTTSVCVRQVAETSGPVVATSNKRDLTDLTRGLRSRVGTVWVFDPQQLATEPAGWWWDPLSYVAGVAEAQELAGLFAAADTNPDDRGDRYFDHEGKTYLAALLLAAAKGGQPITRLLDWAARPGLDEPAAVLDSAGHGGMAKILRGVRALADKQRDGVVGTARAYIGWLANPQLLPWITPAGPGDDRPRFDPARFVASRQTLYVLSMEGAGSARAVTAALTVATVKAAEKLAAGSPRGRLPLPLTVVLDEAANICRWPDLPDLYSHYGSRGIALSTFLQSWNQGVEVWGRDGMEKLWSAANIRVVGPGLAQAEHLNNLSSLIGDHDVVARDTSRSPQSGGLWSSNRSTSTRLQRERIFDAADLAAMPRGRAVMLAVGAPAALIELTFYGDTDYADDLRASEDYYTHLHTPPVDTPTSSAAAVTA